MTRTAGASPGRRLAVRGSEQTVTHSHAHLCCEQVPLPTPHVCWGPRGVGGGLGSLCTVSVLCGVLAPASLWGWVRV